MAASRATISRFIGFPFDEMTSHGLETPATQRLFLPRRIRAAHTEALQERERVWTGARRRRVGIGDRRPFRGIDPAEQSLPGHESVLRCSRKPTFRVA